MNIYQTASLLAIACSGPCILANDSNCTYETVTEDTRYTALSEYDYKRIADELGVEIAVIKAVSDIEAGKSHQGFIAPGMPTLNFSKNMFSNNLRKRGVTVSSAVRRSSEAFKALNRKKYGSYGKAQHARLKAAMEIDSVSAILSCYWGMFQIGGFNWRRCQVESVDEFARLMAESEAMQLELFARFMQSTGMVEYLRKKNWRAFARAYNGAGYARKGYHTRLAAAYARYSRK